ncbi:MAG TPA: RdgB/HAM1 family non-canonical purine NTP pyrophosphatase [Bacillota bacterium]
MSWRRQMLLATTNPGKIAEIRAALAGLDLELKTLRDVSGYQPPAETASTFWENALLKARAAFAATGWPALADDSGLEVDALGGAPGVHSARFGGDGLTDADRCRLLLERLEGVPMKQRTARFRAVLALCRPDAPPTYFEGTLEGWIGWEPKGHGGFGYDPVFYLRDDRGRFLDRALAELSRDEKNAISHRGQALRRLRAALERWLAD